MGSPFPFAAERWSPTAQGTTARDHRRPDDNSYFGGKLLPLTRGGRYLECKAGVCAPHDRSLNAPELIEIRHDPFSAVALREASQEHSGRGYIFDLTGLVPAGFEDVVSR